MAKIYQYYASGEYAGEGDDYGTGILPNNATTQAPPSGPWGRQWPRWTGTEWELVPDHRERSAALYSPELVQKATDYWLPAEGDDWQSHPRRMKDIGPLPEGAVTVRPEKPAELALADAQEAKTAEFDRAMTAIDAELIRPTSDLVAVMVTSQVMAADADGATALSADDLEMSRQRFLVLRQAQAQNRVLRAQVQTAGTVEEVEALKPVMVASPL